MASQSVTLNSTARKLNLTREMHVESPGDTRGMSGKRLMKLKMYERYLDSNEIEIRTELSCPTDDSTVYAGGVTKKSYESLRHKHKLTVDFEHLAERLRAQLTHSDKYPVEIYVIISQDQSKCTLEVSRPTDPYDLKRTSLPLELFALNVDEHLAYVRTELKAQIKISKKYQEDKENAEERIKQLEKEMQNASVLEEENEDLRSKLEVATEQAEDHKIDLNAANQKLEAAERELEMLNVELREGKEEQINMVDDMERMMETADQDKRMNEQLRDELDVLERRMSDKESELDEVKYRLKKANSEIDSLHRKLKKLEKEPLIQEKVMKMVHKGEERPMQSFDEKKLRELEADLKEKSEMVETLSTRVNTVTKENEQLNEKLMKLQQELIGQQRLIDVYRRSSPSVSHGITPTGHYSSSPLTYHTPPTTFNPTTPGTSRPLGVLEHRTPLNTLNRPPLLSKNPLTAGPLVPSSPRILSYQNPITHLKPNNGTNN